MKFPVHFDDQIYFIGVLVAIVVKQAFFILFSSMRLIYAMLPPPSKIRFNLILAEINPISK